MSSRATEQAAPHLRPLRVLRSLEAGGAAADEGRDEDEEDMVGAGGAEAAAVVSIKVAREGVMVLVGTGLGRIRIRPAGATMTGSEGTTRRWQEPEGQAE